MHPTRIFKSPDELEIAWKLYKEDLLLQAKDWQKVQYVGKEGQRMSDDLKLPYTMEGFEVFVIEVTELLNNILETKTAITMTLSLSVRISKKKYGITRLQAA